jgi:alpha-mannosidase
MHSAIFATDPNFRRHVVRAGVVIALVMALWSPAWRAGEPPVSGPPPGGYTIYVAPHSHMDMVWYWTYDKTEVMAIKILRQALEMLKKDPRYTFTQDQMMALRPFWDTLSDSDRQFLRRMVQEGRFEVTTGMNVQPDVAGSDYESLTREFFPALPWMEETFRTKVLTAWNIDTYGHSIQMPQLFRSAGLRYFVFMRDVLPALEESVKSPFYWESPDGSKLLSYWLSGSYDIRWQGIAPSLKRFVDHNVEGNDKIFVLWGTDLYFPSDSSAEIEKQLRAAATKNGIPVKAVILCTPRRYFADVEKSGVPLPTYHYDFYPPLFIQDLRGLYGERPNDKMANRRAEDTLESSEKFSSVASLFGRPYPLAEFERAWANVTFNQDHDALPGSHIDPVDDWIMADYNGAIDTGRQALARSLYDISRRINTSRGGEFPFLVFNALSFKRTEVVEYTPLFKESLKNFRVLDDGGNVVPFRLLDAMHHGLNDPLSMAAIEFIAKDVPALGYRLYRIESMEGPPQPSSWRAAKGEISNRFFTLRLDILKGTLSSLINRQTNQELLDTGRYGGNELVIEDEKDPDTEGTTHFTGTEVLGDQFPADSVQRMDDDLGTRIRIQGPFLGGRRTQEITIYNDLPRIDFRTKLLGFPGHDGMLAAVFPLRNGQEIKLDYETQNAVTQRPDGIYNAQTWMDAQSEGNGVALINNGMAGLITKEGVLKMILLRSITNYRGYYAPNASEAGSHDFQYSLYAHEGDWSRGGVAEQAHSFNSPLRVIATDSHSGALPPVHGFLAVESGHFEVTALKRAEDSRVYILRGHETEGQQGVVRLHIDLPFRDAWFADLAERQEQRVHIEQGVIQFECKPFQFVTLRLTSGN